MDQDICFLHFDTQQNLSKFTLACNVFLLTVVEADLFLKGKFKFRPTIYFQIVQIYQYLNEMNMYRLTIKQKKINK